MCLIWLPYVFPSSFPQKQAFFCQNDPAVESTNWKRLSSPLSNAHARAEAAWGPSSLQAMKLIRRPSQLLRCSHSSTEAYWEDNESTNNHAIVQHIHSHTLTHTHSVNTSDLLLPMHYRNIWFIPSHCFCFSAVWIQEKICTNENTYYILMQRWDKECSATWWKHANLHSAGCVVLQRMPGALIVWCSMCA